MKAPASFFGDLSVEQFLSEYWQKKPLLVRGAWPGFETPLSPDQFMDLSTREDAFSRMIIERPKISNWELREGPFERAEFDAMPDSHWTLLIQEVDRLVPAVWDMLKAVSFLPAWRLDDVMISYAANGGGVGAHIDNYDVFLLQGYGQRRWQINTEPVVEENLVEDIDVSILADFVPDRDWVLEPGDMLYLPPRVAHFGVALGPCMTYSIGCRAPSKQEMIVAVIEQAMMTIDSDDRYNDPSLRMTDETGRVGSDLIAWIKSSMAELLSDDKDLRELIGSILSQPRRWVEEEALPEDTLSDALQNGGRVRPASANQLLWDRKDDSSMLLFAAGEAIELDRSFEALIRKLIEGDGLTGQDLADQSELAELLDDLYGQGTLVVDPA